MSLKINSILPKHQSTTQFKPKTTPKIADKTKQTNQAINRLAVRFGGDEETKPAKKTGDTFLKEVIAEQPIKIKDKNTKKETIAMKADKSADKMTKGDYDMSFRRAVYGKAMLGVKLTDADIKLADQTLKNAELYNSNYDLKTDVKDLQEKQRESGRIIKVNVGTENLEKAKVAGQAVLQFREYESKKLDAAIQHGKNYATDALGGFVQPIVNAPINIINGVSEPFRAGEKMLFGTQNIPTIPRMEVAERSEYWNKDNRMLANKGAEIGATIIFGGGAGAKALGTKGGRALLGFESSYNIASGAYGKDVNQPDANGNPRQMDYLERGGRVFGGVFGARQVVKAEITTPNSIINNLDDIFKPKPPTTEAITPEGFRVRVPNTENVKGANVDKMRLPDMDEQIIGKPVRPNWKTKLGEGQDVDDLQEVNKVGAGMKAKPQHHVFPQEYRKFFEERGFVGQRSIDKFVVKLSDADHQAIHGGANWKLARKVWKDGEWNSKVMKDIMDAEQAKGAKLTFNEIKSLVENLMKRYEIPRNYQDYRGGVK